MANKITTSSEYNIWHNMIRRCTNPNCANWVDYGKRGITVAEEWKGKNGFYQFLSDVGQRPSLKHSLDRIDNNKGYCKDNCRWATIDIQSRNKRSIHDLSWVPLDMLIEEGKRRGLI